MFIRALQILLYIFHCLRIGAKPWLFFQLNAQYFNKSKGIFSKLDIDQLIPARWRLAQYRDTGVEMPEAFPVFVKPEWGQNSAGIHRANSQVQLDQIRSARPKGNIPFLIQEAAKGDREFEIYLIPSLDGENISVLSVIETRNNTAEKLPINGIHNHETHYHDLTQTLDTLQREAIWSHLKRVGPFRMARFGMRSNNLQDIIDGNFQIFEINLFIPMPLALLAKNNSFIHKLQEMNRITTQLARQTSTLHSSKKRSSVFFRQLVAHRENKTREQKATHKTMTNPAPKKFSAVSSVVRDPAVHEKAPL